MSLKKRLTLSFLLVGLLPLVLVSWLAMERAQSALEQRAQEQLSAIRSIKKNAIEAYFGTIRDQALTFSSDPFVIEAMASFANNFHGAPGEEASASVAQQRAAVARYYRDQFMPEFEKQNPGHAAVDIDEVLAALSDSAVRQQYAYIAANQHPLGAKLNLDRADGDNEYNRLHAQFHPAIREYLQKFGYYDIFLVDGESGDVVYSVFKELDYATSLLTGPYAKTGLGEAFQRARNLNKGEFAIVDYQLYFPSYDAPASFIGTPVYNGNRRIGVLLFQLPLANITQVMSERAGLGETGQTYLVGADGLMRSDSFLDPEHRSVVTSFRNPKEGSAKTAAVEAALSGATGEMRANNFLGNDVLSAYMPVDAAGLKWALMAEINADEAFADVAALRQIVMMLTVGFALVAIFIGWWTTRGIVNPVAALASVMANAERTGRFNERVEISSKDEIGAMANAFNSMLERLGRVLVDANDTLKALGEGRLEARMTAEAEGDLLTLREGVNSAVVNVAQNTAEQHRQAKAIEEQALVAQRTAEEISRTAAENARVRQALDQVSTGAMIADGENRIVYLNHSLQTMLRRAEADLRAQNSAFRADAVIGSSLADFYQRLGHHQSLRDLSATAKGETTAGKHVFTLTASPIIRDAQRIGTVMEWVDRSEEVAVEKEVEQLVSAAARGDFSVTIDTRNKTGFFAKLTGDLNHLTTNAEQALSEAARVLNALANGELNETMQGNFAGTFASLQEATNTTVARLTDTIGGINEASQQVASASNELAQASNDLRHRTEEQQSSLEGAAAAIVELSESVKGSADSAALANDLAESARDQAVRGGEVVHGTIAAMEEINHTSQKIGEISSLINEIAFQTNLLALNAAVEAARAGEQGRGFAVVAGEVRNLAQRTSEAAKNITTLIRTSADRVQEGARMAQLSGETLTQVVSAFEKVTAVVRDVSESTKEQASNIASVSASVSSLEALTQQNAAAAEQSSAASEALAEQTRSVSDLVGFFRIG